MPQRVQMTRTRPWRPDHPDAVIVDRRTPWGNPFRPGDEWVVEDDGCGPGVLAVQDLADAAGAFWGWLTGDDFAITELAGRREWILDHLSDLTGRDLACWCPLDQPCHGDVLLELANRPAVTL